MTILSKLSSQVGSRGQEANAGVARLCLAHPDHLVEVAAHLVDPNAKVAGDCAEVLAMTAAQRPDLVAAYAPALLALLDRRNGRVRWEAAHALALVTPHAPDVVGMSLEALGRITQQDERVIVRDYVLDAIAAYGATGGRAAEAALPWLRAGLSSWGGRHAARVLRGLAEVVAAAPSLAPDVTGLAEPLRDHTRPVIRKAARHLLATTSGPGGPTEPARAGQGAAPRLARR